MEGASQCSGVSAEAVEFDLRDGGLFASLLAFTVPSTVPGGEGAGGVRSSSSSSRSEEVADWQCLRVTFGREGLLLRGVSKGREVYGELLLPVSFFEGFEYQRQQQQQQQKQEEGESVLVPLKSFVNALLLFGESAHMRLRYTFGEGVLLLLLQQPQQQPQQQQVFSEIEIKTYTAQNPQLFREVLQELLLGDDDTAARVVVEWTPPRPKVAAGAAAATADTAAGTPDESAAVTRSCAATVGNSKAQQMPLMTLVRQSRALSGSNNKAAVAATDVAVCAAAVT
ncbi:hypothetical protein, conserved [Eimeria tenella]|uniref:Uncharacterized protein n=1 Tax=Eimeria tenella TaxID=5802 RepID=U6L7M2_EIMTE|nr:hypothetical protein, conserved [Eimeria tenella]CDJ45208.1 hypothetical protein, conserved [Eimeria tenella]|eukprot:XP_013235955.1 hypothetical protein, conserved [Eimeria tenella]